MERFGNILVTKKFTRITYFLRGKKRIYADKKHGQINANMLIRVIVHFSLA